MNVTDSSYNMNRNCKNSILNIFMVLAKVHFQDYLCKRLLCKMYLYEDRAENRRGPSKALKDDKYMFKLYKDWGRSC